MSAINKQIASELLRLIGNAARKREMLRQNAFARSTSKKRLTILSGTLALLSAGAITSVIIKYFGNGPLQIIAAFSAALSGFSSIVLATYYREEETTKLFEGSAKYLSLRDKSHRLLINPSLNSVEVFKQLEELETTYATLEETYCKYANHKSDICYTSGPGGPHSVTFSSFPYRQFNQSGDAPNTEIDPFNPEVASSDGQHGA